MTLRPVRPVADGGTDRAAAPPVRHPQRVEENRAPKAKATAEAAPSGGGRTLVIVESPAKARRSPSSSARATSSSPRSGTSATCPRAAAEIPAAVKDEAWARLGVDVDNGFKPLYVVPADKKAQVAKLKSLLEGRRRALPRDRRGPRGRGHRLAPARGAEAQGARSSAWCSTRSPRRPSSAAIENPREVDAHLVDAQEARRILDRLYGYEVSPVLWRKVAPRPLGRRVQRVATRLVVERERERIAFRSAPTGTSQATLEHRGAALPGARSSRSTASASPPARTSTTTGRARRGRRRACVLDEAARDGARRRRSPVADFAVRSVEEKPYRRSPPPPFMTSTLQQEAGRKLRLRGPAHDAGRAAALRERLHHLHAHRHHDALGAGASTPRARRSPSSTAPSTCPRRPARYDQQGEERAGGPRGHPPRRRHRSARPSEVAGELGGDELALYDLIWKRTVASQMLDARGQTADVRLGATGDRRPRRRVLARGTRHHVPRLPARRTSRASTTTRATPARRATGERRPAAARGRRRARPPSARARGPRDQAAGALHRGPPRQGARGARHRPPLDLRQHHRDDPRPRVRREAGQRARADVHSPSRSCSLLEEHFTDLVDYDFTARHGGRPRRDRRRRARPRRPCSTASTSAIPRASRRPAAARHRPRRDRRPRDRLDPDRQGSRRRRCAWAATAPYVERERRARQRARGARARRAHRREGRRAARTAVGRPRRSATTRRRASRSSPRPVATARTSPSSCPRARRSRRSRARRRCSPTWPSTRSTSAPRCKLLSLPREVGSRPGRRRASITAQNGRYGPYITKEKDSRSLPSEESIFTVTLEEALALLAQPKQRAGRPPPSRASSVGVDPSSGKEVQLKEGRFGPYVTDGETNASLRRADDPGPISIERAADLLAERRAKDPAPKKRGREEGPGEEGCGQEARRQEDRGEEGGGQEDRRRRPPRPPTPDPRGVTVKMLVTGPRKPASDQDHARLSCSGEREPAEHPGTPEFVEPRPAGRRGPADRAGSRMTVTSRTATRRIRTTPTFDEQVRRLLDLDLPRKAGIGVGRFRDALAPSARGRAGRRGRQPTRPRRHRPRCWWW